MPPDRTERVSSIVEEALDRPSATRSEFVHSACGADAELRVEVESLLAFESKAAALMNVPAVEANAAAVADLESGEFKPGDSVGDNRILSLLGEGGMGEVYLAEETTLGRTVAIKVVKRGAGTPAVIRHFHHEERILASLNHPNIARLYGGDVTPRGSPYFVMEYIEGERLDDYCRSRSLPLLDRLELFRKICSAVAYAHQHLIIHRDIKPANIRVTAEGEPKLLDFGIARLLEPDTQVPGQTLTLPGVMTPDYASPEQVRGERMTTASDVYSLGVVLYELLTGVRPFHIETRDQAKISRAISELTPARPSSAAPAQAKCLRGDLDNIVLMALRKEPERRYASVGQLSEDVRRHLEGRPVRARKDTAAYRATKFARRNKIAVIAAAVVVLALVGGMIGTTWQARIARREKAKAEGVAGFLKDMLAYSNPLVHAPGKQTGKTTIEDMLDDAARRLQAKPLADHGEVRAELEKIIADSYLGQGRHDLWEEHLRRYIAIERSLYPPSDPRAMVATAQWAILRNHADRAESERTFRQVIPKMRTAYAGGKINPNDLADALMNFGYLRRAQGDSKEAESLFRETIALGPKMSLPQKHWIDVTKSTLASTLADQGKFEEALETARRAVLECRQTDRAATPDFAFMLTVYGGFLTEKGDFAEADRNLHEAEQILRLRLSSSSLWVGDNLRNQAISFYRQGRYDEAQDKLTEAEKIYLESFGPGYDHYPTVLIVKGLVLDKLGRSQEGETVLRQALKLRTDSLPKEHFWVAIAQGALGECLMTQKRLAEAESLLVDSHNALVARLGPADPRTAEASRRLEKLRLSFPQPDVAIAR